MSARCGPPVNILVLRIHCSGEPSALVEELIEAAAGHWQSLEPTIQHNISIHVLKVRNQLSHIGAPFT